MSLFNAENNLHIYAIVKGRYHSDLETFVLSILRHGKVSQQLKFYAFFGTLNSLRCTS